MRRLMSALACLALVGVVCYGWSYNSCAQDWGVGGTRVDVITDPPQGYSKVYQKDLQCAPHGNGTTTYLITPDSGYWFHEIGLKKIASYSHNHVVQFKILPYASTTDSTSIATHITVTFPSSQSTGEPVMLPINCYQWTVALATPSTCATRTTMKAFMAIGYEKKHN